MNSEQWRTVKMAFTAARAAPMAKRLIVAKAHCRTDDEAFQQARRLLRHAMAGETTDVDPLSGPGQRQVGPYEILEQIGSGASSIVYRARDTRQDRLVALKVLRLALASERGRRRFEMEGDVLSVLSHRGIARVYETGSTSTEFGMFPFIAMELVDGKPIDVYCDEQSLDDEARIDLMARACDAMAYAHRRGVIHRDLKPVNILVDHTGQPKIVDFGIARSVIGELHATTLITQTGDVLGTPGYMSPEQCRGTSYAADTRADVYALGVVLYELLARARLFDVGDLPVLAALEVIKRAETPLIGSIRPALRGPIENLLAKAMCRDPRKRYESAASLGDDLRRALRGEPVQATSAASRLRLRRTLRQHRLALAAMCVISTALTMTLIMLADSARTSRAKATIMHDSFAIIAAEDLTDAKAHLRRVHEVEPRADLTLDEKCVLYDRLAGRFVELGDVETATGLYAASREAMVRQSGRSDKQSLRALQVYTEALSMSGSPAKAERLIRDELSFWGFTPALVNMESHAPELTQRLLRLTMTLGEAMARQGRYDQSIQLLSSVLAAQVRMLPASDENTEHTDISNTREILRVARRLKGDALSSRP